MKKNLLFKSRQDELREDLFEVTSPINLINNPDMTDYLALMMFNTNYTNAQSLGVKNEIEKIISLINEELRKKK